MYVVCMYVYVKYRSDRSIMEEEEESNVYVYVYMHVYVYVYVCVMHVCTWHRGFNI